MKRFKEFPEYAIAWEESHKSDKEWYITINFVIYKIIKEKFLWINYESFKEEAIISADLSRTKLYSLSTENLEERMIKCLETEIPKIERKKEIDKYRNTNTKKLIK